MDSPVKKILVYIDGSEKSILAAQYAICLAKFTNADLYAQYVINSRALEELLNARIFVRDEQVEYKRNLEDDAVRYLRFVSELGVKKGVTISTIKSSGNLMSEILASVKREGIDLLVVGELAEIRSRREEFYDESERMIRAVSCSVMVVKNEDTVLRLYDML